MSILATKKRRRAIKKWILAYLAIAVFVWIFGMVYESFSHEVYSAYMMYAFLIPLIGGALVFLLIALFSRRVMPGKFAFNAYNSGIAALTVGCIFQGVLEIYGTTNQLISVYWFAGFGLSALGAASFVIGILKNSREKSRRKRYST